MTLPRHWSAPICSPSASRSSPPCGVGGLNGLLKAPQWLSSPRWAVLLAKATNPAVDVFVILAREGSPGAFNLRAAATALGAKKRAFGYDIGSSSDRDPINHGTLIGSTRWDVALDRIREDHKPFFQLILTWLADVNEGMLSSLGELAPPI